MAQQKSFLCFLLFFWPHCQVFSSINNSKIIQPKDPSIMKMYFPCKYFTRLIFFNRRLSTLIPWTIFDSSRFNIKDRPNIKFKIINSPALSSIGQKMKILIKSDH